VGRLGFGPFPQKGRRLRYLSTVLDDFSRYIIAWKLCTNLRAEDVTDTLDLVLAASGCDSATVLHKPRLLSNNGPSYIAGELAECIEANKTPADAYFGRAQSIIKQRERIKRQTIEHRRLRHRKLAA